MTARQFNHSFFPQLAGAAVPNIIDLTTTEIADAAIREIMQIQLTTAPFDLLLDQLLVPGDKWFRWIGPLGQIRETRTALSGLFGRFVARAYLTRYHNFAYFEPIRSNLPQLSGWPNLTVRRLASGDLPDWIVATASGTNDIAIAEAKGSHNMAGPWPSLGAAKTQSSRVGVFSGNVQENIKRYAIATRWAVQNQQGLIEPWLAVHDPEQGERDPTPEERAYLRRSIALGHFASIAEALQLEQMAATLYKAKTEKPGTLVLPDVEMVTVSFSEDGSPPYQAIAAAVTPSGIIPIPRDADLQEFQSALETVFPERVMLFLVASEAIQAVDSEVVAAPTDPSFRLPVARDDVPLWSSARLEADGSRLHPSASVVLSRTPPISSVGS